MNPIEYWRGLRCRSGKRPGLVAAQIEQQLLTASAVHGLYEIKIPGAFANLPRRVDVPIQSTQSRARSRPGGTPEEAKRRTSTDILAPDAKKRVKDKESDRNLLVV